MILKEGKVLLVAPRLYRGFRPKNFQELQVLGVKVSISLETGAIERLTQSDYEHQSAAEHGIIRIDWALSNFWGPTPQTLRRLVELVETFRKKGMTVYVHCRWGKDRTGMYFAARRILIDGWSYEKAKEELFRMGFRKHVYFLWLRHLKALEAFRKANTDTTIVEA